LTNNVPGIFIGVNAAIISIITEWLSDIKMGYCMDGWWLNSQLCCWEVESDDEFCPSWHLWSTATLARWLIYVMFAVSPLCLHISDVDKVHVYLQAIFSFVAAHLVRNMAKYAAGSGISEIKCILTGFVMQGFLGYATFFIKSLTLVSRLSTPANNVIDQE
jgi:chloride channel 3/4/5